MKTKKTHSLLPDNIRQTTQNSAVDAPVETLIKIEIAARILCVSAVTVRRRVHDGSLRHIRIRGRLYFRRGELEAFIARHSGG
jgi:excisionase family DNA binding protein